MSVEQNSKKKEKKPMLYLDQFERKHQNIPEDEILEEYVNYLDDYFGNEKVVVFRWGLPEEIDSIYDLEEGESMEDLGSEWNEPFMSTHDYEEEGKYMHFFKNFQDKDQILYGVDKETHHKGALEIFAFDKDFIEQYEENEGVYSDENDDFVDIEEYAIPSYKVNQKNFIESISIEDERLNSSLYDSTREAFRRQHEILGDFYDGIEGDFSDDYSPEM